MKKAVDAAAGFSLKKNFIYSDNGSDLIFKNTKNKAKNNNSNIFLIFKIALTNLTLYQNGYKHHPSNLLY